MKKSKQFFLTSLLLMVTMTAFAQKEKKEIRTGNDRYEKGNYSDAETEYRKALEKNQSSYPGTYNLGGALYRQKKFDEAVQQYQQSIERTTDPKEKASSYHNLGNSMVKAQKYAESIDAYKKALKLNPSDNDTRYNLAYAQAMLRKQQEQQQQDQQNQNQNQDQKNKDQKNQQNKDQQKKDQQNQDQKSQDQKNKEQQKDQQKKEAQQPKISKEDAERLLKALKNDEQNLQQKLSRKEGEKIRIEKDW